MSQLMTVYSQILAAVGLTVKEDGSVFDKNKQYLVRGKPLVLPLDSVLRSPDVREKLVFHPFGEAAAKGESHVIEDMRVRMTGKINYNVSRLVALMCCLGRGDIKKQVDALQLEALASVKDVGEKENRDIVEILKATTRGEGKRTPLVKIYLHKHGKKVDHKSNERRSSRTAAVTFPLYDVVKHELESKTKGYTLLGVKTNEKTLKSLLSILEFIFPNIGEKEAYYAYGYSQVSPFCDALFRAVGNLITCINERFDMFKDTSEVGIEKMPETWAEVVDLLDGLYNEICLIPVQPNADGLATHTDMQTAVLNAATQAPVEPTPAPAGAPALAVSSAPAVPAYTTPTQAPAPATATQEPEWIVVNGAMRRNPNYRAPVVMGGYTAPMQNSLDPYNAPTMLPSSAGHVQQAVNQYGRPVYVAPVNGGYVQPDVQQQGGMNLSNMDFHQQVPNYTNGIPRI